MPSDPYAGPAKVWKGIFSSRFRVSCFYFYLFANACCKTFNIELGGTGGQKKFRLVLKRVVLQNTSVYGNPNFLREAPLAAVMVRHGPESFSNPQAVAPGQNTSASRIEAN